MVSYKFEKFNILQNVKILGMGYERGKRERDKGRWKEKKKWRERERGKRAKKNTFINFSDLILYFFCEVLQCPLWKGNMLQQKDVYEKKTPYCSRTSTGIIFPTAARLKRENSQLKQLV